MPSFKLDFLLDGYFAWRSASSTYELDIGMPGDGRTLAIEVNDGFALRNYGLAPLKAIKLPKARWKEMTRPYFEKVKQFIISEACFTQF